MNSVYINVKNCHMSVSSGLIKGKNGKITSDLKFTVAYKQLSFQFFNSSILHLKQKIE